MYSQIKKRKIRQPAVLHNIDHPVVIPRARKTSDRKTASETSTVSIDIVYGTEDGEKTLIVLTNAGNIEKIPALVAEEYNLLKNATFVATSVSAKMRYGRRIFRRVKWSGFAKIEEMHPDFVRQEIDIPDDVSYLFDLNR
jgi:hypothetical protein